MFPNIIFIIIDALRQMNMSCYGYNKITTPNIDALVKDSIIFNNAFSTTNATDPSITSILSGKYPSNHGITAHGDKVNKTHINTFYELNSKFLQEYLKLNSYKTIAIDFLGRWHKIGFDEYLPEQTRKSFSRRLFKKVFSLSPKFIKKLLRKIGIKLGLLKTFDPENMKFLKYARDNLYTKITQDKILENSKGKKPFFIFLHYWSVHIPYDTPNEFLEEFINSDYGNILTSNQVLTDIEGEWKPRLERFFSGINSTLEMSAKYDASIKYVDAEIGKIITTLKEQGMYNDTIILITSDHGESLTEHGIFFDHHGLYDETIRVPLIIKLPNKQFQKINQLVQHNDIVPTFLEYLNIHHSNEFDGKSLISLIENDIKLRDIIYTEEFHTTNKRSIRSTSFKYISALSQKDAMCKYCGKIHGGIEELYDLINDPKELRNIVKEKPKIATEFRNLLNIKIMQFQEKRKISNVIRDLKGIGKI